MLNYDRFRLSKPLQSQIMQVAAFAKKTQQSFTWDHGTSKLTNCSQEYIYNLYYIWQGSIFMPARSLCSFSKICFQPIRLTECDRAAGSTSSYFHFYFMPASKADQRIVISIPSCKQQIIFENINCIMKMAEIESFLLQVAWCLNMD